MTASADSHRWGFYPVEGGAITGPIMSFAHSIPQREVLSSSRRCINWAHHVFSSLCATHGGSTQQYRRFSNRAYDGLCSHIPQFRFYPAAAAGSVRDIGINFYIRLLGSRPPTFQIPRLSGFWAPPLFATSTPIMKLSSMWCIKQEMTFLTIRPPVSFKSSNRIQFLSFIKHGHEASLPLLLETDPQKAFSFRQASPPDRLTRGSVP